jgi:hypothetical protein
MATGVVVNFRRLGRVNSDLSLLSNHQFDLSAFDERPFMISRLLATFCFCQSLPRFDWGAVSRCYGTTEQSNTITSHGKYAR